MNDRQAAEFEANKECNFAINPAGIGRYRVNAFVQQGNVGIVLRVITTTIPKIEELGLPSVLKDVIMTKRGLVIMVGATGCGNRPRSRRWSVSATRTRKVTSSRSRTPSSSRTRTRAA